MTSLITKAAVPVIFASGCASQGHFDVESVELDGKTIAVDCASSDLLCQDGLNRGYICGQNVAKSVTAPSWSTTRRITTGSRLNPFTYSRIEFIQCVPRGEVTQ